VLHKQKTKKEEKTELLDKKSMESERSLLSSIKSDLAEAEDASCDEYWPVCL